MLQQFDGVSALWMFFSTALGLYRGGNCELQSFIQWTLSLGVALTQAQSFKIFLPLYLPEFIPGMILFFLTFMGLQVCFTLLDIFSGARASPLNKLCGGLVGFVRGWMVLFSIIYIMVLQGTPESQKNLPLVTNSYTYTLCESFYALAKPYYVMKIIDAWMEATFPTHPQHAPS